jgi:hypothetical protein
MPSNKALLNFVKDPQGLDFSEATFRYTNRRSKGVVNTKRKQLDFPI